MRPVPKLVSICAASALLTLSAVSTAAAGGDHGDHNDHDDHSSAKVLLEGLSSPKGLAVNADKNLVVAQGAFGPPGPVLEFILRGPDKGQAFPITDPTTPFNITDVAVSPKDGTGWAISPVVVVDPNGEPILDPETGDPITEGHLFHQLADGSIVDVLNIATYQAGDPDEFDHDDPPNPIESNPYGLTVMRNGDALVADAAGNDVIRVTPEGKAITVARFDLQSLSTAHVPPDFPLPGPLPERYDAEAVPTTVTIGPDGAIYVGELKGFPFEPGTSNIWRIKPNAEGAWCSVNSKDPTRKCSLYSSGYTGIQDIAFDKDSGKLYVYELAGDGVFAFEAGFATGVFPPAVLLEVKKGWHGERRTELATGELSQPGGVIVVKGKVYVTDGVFTGGRLLRISRDGW